MTTEHTHGHNNPIHDDKYSGDSGLNRGHHGGIGGGGVGSSSGNGFFNPPTRKFANPAPLGLCGFALTTFVLSVIQMGARNIAEPNIVVAAAFGYGGLVQLLAGMWEMAVGNTFGATALSSYGGFWISFAIILTPGGFEIVEALGGGASAEFLNSFGIFLMGWFIFTFMLVLTSARTSVMFFLIFVWLDMAFLLLGIGYLQHSDGAPHSGLIKAGGVFACLSAFWAWYNAFVALSADGNGFFTPPVVNFPWGKHGSGGRAGKKHKTEPPVEQSAV